MTNMYKQNLGTLFAIETVQKTVKVFDFAKKIVLNEFKTSYEFGGQRMAVLNTDFKLLTAAWAKNGIVCYDIMKGNELWKLKGKSFNKVQYVTSFYNNSDIVFIGFNNAPAILISISDGTIIEKLNGVLTIFDGPQSEIVIRGSNFKIDVIINSFQKPILKSIDLRTIPIITALVLKDFALIRYGFYEDFCCYDLKSDSILWTIKLNVLKLFKANSLEYVYGIIVVNESDLVIQKLVKILIKTGKLENCFNLEISNDFIFFEDFSQLLGMNGTIYNVETGLSSKWNYLNLFKP
jgi:hypothetical protein